MIFFSDMDGTFLTSTKRVSDESRRALDALADAGIEFVPCTGRPLSGVPAEVLAHPSVHHAVAANGAVIARLDEAEPWNTARAAVIHRAPLSRDTARRIWRIARRFDVTFDIFADGACLSHRDVYARLDEFVNDPHILSAMRATRTPVDTLPLELIDSVDVLERVAMYWKDPADRDAILAELARVPNIEVTRSYPMNIKVMQRGTSKGSALEWLCRELGVPVADAVAFGDNMNDISMLQAAGTGVAMANAEAAVRAAADAVAASNDEDGVAASIFQMLKA